MLENYETWFLSQIDGLTDNIVRISPSEWAEQYRRLPESVTRLPGLFNFDDVVPYMKEIVDCLDPRSPIQYVSLMKGAQIAWTTAVLENAVGYLIAVLKSTPSMLVTADAELAKMRMDAYITPMVQHSELSHLIQSNDQLNKRKQGSTNTKLEWSGGGWLLPFGANSANKLRSFSICVLLMDEVDGFPEQVGKDGDPCKLAEARTKSFAQVRKIFRGSTPLIKQTSKIEPYFLEGDQRYFMVPCVKCGQHQRLEWRGKNEESDPDLQDEWGIVFELEDGRMKQGSVHYKCKYCGHLHKNSDKTKMLPQGYWQATATPSAPNIRSYHLNALYSPAFMYSWDDAVKDFIDVYDVEQERVKNIAKYQEWVNNVKGETWDNSGTKVQLIEASAHRRTEYLYGQVPNLLCESYGHGKIQLLTMAVDVHKEHLEVAVFGWARGDACFLVNYWRLEGDCENINDPTWNEVHRLITEAQWESAGRIYRIAITLIDSGYNTELVMEFCERYADGSVASVYPIKGIQRPKRGNTIKEFSSFESQMGVTGYNITVDLYKDKWAASIKRCWNGVTPQPNGVFNAPADITGAQLKQLTVESKKEVTNKLTNKVEGWEWTRPGHAPNELWDLLVYNNAALDMCVWDVCINRLEMDTADRELFWDRCEGDEAQAPLYWLPVDDSV